MSTICCSLCSGAGSPFPDPVPRIRIRDEDRARAERLWRQLRLQPPVVALHPGSGGRRKCWPLSRFLALADQLQRRGCRILVLHGEAEADIAATLQERLPPKLPSPATAQPPRSGRADRQGRPLHRQRLRAGTFSGSGGHSDSFHLRAYGPPNLGTARPLQPVSSRLPAAG